MNLGVLDDLSESHCGQARPAPCLVIWSGVESGPIYPTRRALAWPEWVEPEGLRDWGEGLAAICPQPIACSFFEPKDFRAFMDEASAQRAQSLGIAACACLQAPYANGNKLVIDAIAKADASALSRLSQAAGFAVEARWERLKTDCGWVGPRRMSEILASIEKAQLEQACPNPMRDIHPRRAL